MNISYLKKNVNEKEKNLEKFGAPFTALKVKSKTIKKSCFLRKLTFSVF
ncbi:hypothetical protein ELI_1834 [Eubacterium callanderi]|uniref:Uncharacterized protein n=1 Tax=Eubacterium callanderi TaxID=53442 RepID=E3GK65_9FIRM|nr:hypothetical protein ELI_1834 [Eubacterium callanderi]